MNTVNSEQWKSDGKCDECRRKPYCNKSCSAHDRLLHTKLFESFRKSDAGRLFDTVQKSLGRDRYI